MLLTKRILLYALISVSLLYLLTHAEFTPIRAVYEQY
jgi:hypothetical protein